MAIFGKNREDEYGYDNGYEDDDYSSNYVVGNYPEAELSFNGKVNFIKYGAKERISLSSITKYRVEGSKKVIITLVTGETLEVKVNADEFEDLMGVWETSIIPK